MISKSKIMTAIVATTAMILATLIPTSLVSAQEIITINLTGNEEVPPVQTEAKVPLNLK